jgi:hypothetical protein
VTDDLQSGRKLYAYSYKRDRNGRKSTGERENWLKLTDRFVNNVDRGAYGSGG